MIIQDEMHELFVGICIELNIFSSHFQPLHKSLDPSNLEHLITPLVTIGHIALLAPDQFAAPLKSLVATFIVKDLLMNDRVIYVS